MRQAARRHNDAGSYKAHLDNLERERSRLRQRGDLAAENLATLDLELEEYTTADAAVQEKLANATKSRAALRVERDRLEAVRDETAERTAELRTQRSGLLSRIEVLEDLERSHEGLGSGAREVCSLVESKEPGPWQTVVGMVAGLLTVRREFAALIDLALGDRAGAFSFVKAISWWQRFVNAINRFRDE